MGVVRVVQPWVCLGHSWLDFGGVSALAEPQTSRGWDKCRIISNLAPLQSPLPLSPTFSLHEAAISSRTHDSKYDRSLNDHQQYS